MSLNHLERATILIVDDNPTNLRVLSEVLGDIGWEVLIANDGESAIDQAMYSPPDLILLDVMMPGGIDGFAACRLLKADPRTKEIPVIFMTALTEVVDKVQGLSLGAVDYITKPFNNAEMIARVRVHLKLSALTKQLENQNLYLEKRVQERTVELEEANKQLRKFEQQLRQKLAQEKELSQLKSRIITNVSHEYRTPLMTILSSSELLEAYRHRWDEEKQKKHFERIRNTVLHMTELIDDVLFVNQAELDKLEFQPQALNPVNLIKELIEELRVSFDSKCYLKFNSEGDYGQSTLDAKIFRQIVYNLISNAIKYSHPGDTVKIKLVGEINQLKLQVSDEGIGISSEDKTSIFESFNRGSNVGNIKGSGLGLAIVKQCLDIHGGKIDFTSEVGIGSSFTVTLPYSQNLDVA